MFTTADLSIWTGRDDSAETGDVRRLFQIVRASEQPIPAGASALLGFSCDAGVLRNQGRAGAAEGPAMLRKVLAGFPAHHHQAVYDCGDITCTDGNLELAQSLLGEHLAGLLAKGVSPVVLGGGHEIAWGSFLGLKQWLQTQELNDTSNKSRHLLGTDSQGTKRKLLILNLDAHFDLRSSRPASSGTPFDQIARDCEQTGRDFQYACWGVSRLGNTAALFQRAASINTDVIEDSNLQERHIEHTLERLDVLMANADDIYLTIDIDVLPASTAPGVSAPAPFGVPLCVVEAIALRVKDSGKMRLADVAEFNPRFDIDGHTARAVARLVWNLMGSSDSRTSLATSVTK